MNMFFKERLLFTFMFLVASALMLIFTFLVCWLISLSELATKIFTNGLIFILISIIIIQICRGINWLFIEPFRKKITK